MYYVCDSTVVSTTNNFNTIKHRFSSNQSSHPTAPMSSYCTLFGYHYFPKRIAFIFLQPSTVSLTTPLDRHSAHNRQICSNHVIKTRFTITYIIIRLTSLFSTLSKELHFLYFILRHDIPKKASLFRPSTLRPEFSPSTYNPIRMKL